MFELQRRPLTLLFLWILVLPVHGSEISDVPRSETSCSPVVSDLRPAVSDVVKAIVRQTSEAAVVEEDMEGTAKLIERPSLAISASLVDADPC